MKKSWMKKVVSFILILIISCGGGYIGANAYSAHTQAEALQWLDSKIGTGIDADGAYGNQCVDLILAYYDYLGVPRSSGNGADYTWNTVPSGWQRIQGAAPQPGDILVYTGGYGHVAIMGNNGASYHQNFNSHSYVEKITYRYNGLSTPYWGVIRPDFASSAQPVQMTFDWDDCQPSKNDVYVYERANPGVTGKFTEAGITFWDSLGRYVGSKTEYINTTYSYLEMWYTASGDMGVSLQPGTKYSYQFYTVYNGTRYNGPVKYFTTVWNETFALATPKLVSATQGNGSVTVKCEPVSGAIGYRYYKRTGNSTYWEVLADLQQTTFVDTAVQDGEKYTYTVRAYRDNIEMANANTYSTTYWSDYDPNGLSITYKVIKEGWQKDSNGWRYRRTDGSFLSNGWYFITGKWYYFNVSGYRLESQWIGNHYVKADGTMASNEWIGNYYVDESGVWVSYVGWLHVDGKWYYIGIGGTRQTGWQYVGGSWYYMNTSGIMQTGWQYVGGAWYYLNASGAMQSGWQYIGGTWYYLNASGAMVTGWQVIGGTWYYFHGSGAMAVNQWVGNYYLQSDGSMATNKWIGPYYVGSDGAWRP